MIEPEQPIVYKRSLGIYNKDDMYRLPREEFTRYRKAAVNVDIDKTGMEERRDGWGTAKISGTFTGLFSNGKRLYGVRNGDLISINPVTYSYSVIQRNLGSLNTDFTDAGYAIYFTNPTIIGFIVNDVAYAIPTILTVSKTAMEAGSLIEFFNNRIYVVKEAQVFYSDATYWNRRDLRTNAFRFNGNITMLKSIKTGMYISDETGVYFGVGGNPSKMVFNKVDDYSVIKGTASKSRSVVINNQFYPNAVFCRTARGVCVGGDDGQWMNLTESKYNIDSGSVGCGLFVKRGKLSQYISIVR